MVARTAAVTLEVARSEPIPDTCSRNRVCVGRISSRNMCPSAAMPTSTTLLGNRVLKDAIKLRGSRTGLGQSLNSMTGVLTGRERCEERHTQGRRLEGTDARDCQQPSGVGSGKEEFSPSISTGTWACRPFNFRLRALEPCENKFLLFQVVHFVVICSGSSGKPAQGRKKEQRVLRMAASFVGLKGTHLRRME